MKKIGLLSICFLLLILFAFFSCKKDKKSNNSNANLSSKVLSKEVVNQNFSYKVFNQETANSNSRKWIIILAVGDGGTINNSTLNDQCKALAAKGYVAITSLYRPYPGSNYTQWYVQFKQDIEEVISQSTQTFNIPRSNVVIGGLSRGGNLTHGLVTPGQMGNIPPIAGIKGIILECAGGDLWKGSTILFPVLFMNNKTDNAVNTTDAETFKTGLQSNPNPNVKNLSKCLIIPGSGHCTNSAQYKDFIVNNIDAWFL